MNNIIGEVERTLAAEAACLQTLYKDIGSQTFEQVVQHLAACRGKIIVSGCGTSAQAGRKIAHTLCCIERPALFLMPSDAVHGGLGVLQKDDILILISKGGNTDELKPLAQACHQKGAFLIGVTENPDSYLGKACDLLMNVKVAQEPCRFNMLATASTLAVIAAFDAVAIALMQYTGFTREQFAIIHPAGAVGHRLLHNTEEEQNG